MCNILTFVDWWVKWKIGSWSLEIWLKNTLDRDLPMMKLLLLLNEFFLYLDALHQNLRFLKQTCTFLRLLTQLSSLSYVCLFVVTFLILPQLVLPWLFYFVVFVSFASTFFILPLLFYFAMAFLFCRDFIVLSWLFYFSVAFLFYRGFFILPSLFSFDVAFLFCHHFLVLLWLFCFAVKTSFCRSCFALP